VTVLIDGQPRRTVVSHPAAGAIEILDQTVLPHRTAWRTVATVEAAAAAIATMQVRGAPLIGVTAAYGLAIAARTDPSDRALRRSADALAATRPTAVNLRWALDRILGRVLPLPEQERAAAAWHAADELADTDVEACRAIGRHTLDVLPDPVDRPLQVMTHCNAGWLATVDRGTALAPVYEAHERGRAVHVWVSETRPRNQGLLTAWELAQQGVPHTLVADNAAGLLIRRGLVDAVLVGADRIAANGDVANKVGTYLKALACADAGVPCYVLAPCSTVDPGCPDGDAIPIEERDGDELRVVRGAVEGDRGGDSDLTAVRVAPPTTAVGNPAFDVTPARLVTAIVTETGVAPAGPDGVARLLAG
jgi:methylthioribose-1-phosphate isomerase